MGFKACFLWLHAIFKPLRCTCRMWPSPSLSTHRSRASTRLSCFLCSSVSSCETARSYQASPSVSCFTAMATMRLWCLRRSERALPHTHTVFWGTSPQCHRHTAAMIPMITHLTPIASQASTIRAHWRPDGRPEPDEINSSWLFVCNKVKKSLLLCRYCKGLSGKLTA